MTMRKAAIYTVGRQLNNGEVTSSRRSERRPARRVADRCQFVRRITNRGVAVDKTGRGQGVVDGEDVDRSMDSMGRQRDDAVDGAALARPRASSLVTIETWQLDAFRREREREREEKRCRYRAGC